MKKIKKVIEKHSKDPSPTGAEVEIDFVEQGFEEILKRISKSCE